MERRDFMQAFIPVPAENKQVDLMDKKVYGCVPGIIMLAANEMTN